MKHIRALFSLSILTEHPILTAIIAVLLMIVLFFALLIWRHSLVKKKARAALDARGQAVLSEPSIPVFATRPFPALIELISPLSGKVIEPSELEDTPDFGGCAILPSEGKVYAPFDCRVAALSDGARSLTLEAEGAAMTIRIGKTNAELAEGIFLPCCKAGDKVKEGDLLLSFDLDLLDSAGYDLTALIFAVDPERFAEIAVTAERKVAVGDHLMTLVPKATEKSSSY